LQKSLERIADDVLAGSRHAGGADCSSAIFGRRRTIPRVHRTQSRRIHADHRRKTPIGVTTL
jgi:hypothetical protein